MTSEQREHFPHRVYLVESDHDTTVLIAIDLFRQGDYLVWLDTVTDRIMQIAQITVDDHDVITFVRQETGGIYTFTPMTLALYNSKVKAKLFRPTDFSDMRSLEKAFTSRPTRM